MQLSTNSEYEKPKATLSCLQCQQRKRKCDKKSPCHACIHAGIACTAISRARLPRGRSAIQRDGGDLRQRVARLEKLLSSQNAGEETVHLTPPQDYAGTPTSAWTSISEEVVGIRELLDNVVGDEPDDPSIEQGQVEKDRIQNFDVLLYSDASCFVQPYVLESLPRENVLVLVDIYLYRVDPVFKVIHAPSLREMLLEAKPLTPAQEALKFAVFYTAVSSLNDQEFSQRFSWSKLAFSNRLRLATEVLISRAGLLTTTNLTTLQAFVIYLAGLRAPNGHRAVGTLLATAVRLGQSLGLELESTKHSPFETELRRRTWCAIGALDLQAAFDNGSYSALAGGAVLGTPPLHIDDADISPSDFAPVRIRNSFTDMTFCSACHEMLRFMRRMIHVPTDADGRPLMQQTWAGRHAMVEECAQTIYEKYIKYCNKTDPFQLFTAVVYEGMVVTLRLLVRRPMYSFYSVEPPPNDGFNVLDVATDVLDQTLRKADNKDFKAWEWFGWVKWYALAVLLAELCEHTEGPRIDKAWNIAEASFAKYESVVHDQALWSSLQKLMRKARSARNFKTTATITCDGSLVSNESISRFEGHEIPAFVTDHQMLDTNGYNGSGHDQLWEEQEMLSWITWESFIQDLGGSS